ncbi:hypothetical protein [Paracoccus sp. (in: a-proteobacteria)]|uniref:hypothetical protein n=1 Tax=Paracoccus sp. TaxID=267 RepID=UPI002897BF84|nr:hypothetical protein [Paracoccus sp. (in: a-proteobacteria)]
MTSSIIIKTTEKEKFYENFKQLSKAIHELKTALELAEPLAISAAAYRVIAPYDAMNDQATLIFDGIDSSDDRQSYL